MVPYRLQLPTKLLLSGKYKTDTPDAPENIIHTSNFLKLGIINMALEVEEINMVHAL